MRTVSKTLAAIAFTIFLLPTAIFARDIFVNNITGEDRFCGGLATVTTSDGPVRTIAKALLLNLPGDRIVLANTGQPYRECVMLQGELQSGNSIKPLALEGNGAILDGSAPVPDEAWQHVAGEVFRYRPPRMAHQQLFTNGSPIARKPLTTDGRMPELQPMEWCLYEGWIYFRGEPGKIPAQHALSFTVLQTGITLYKVHDVVIHNLKIQGFQLDGINANDGVRNGRVVGVTSRGNGRSGVCVAAGSRLELSRCTLEANGTAQLLLEEFPLVRVFDSVLKPDSAPAIVRHDEGLLYVDGELLTNTARRGKNRPGISSLSSNLRWKGGRP